MKGNYQSPWWSLVIPHINQAKRWVQLTRTINKKTCKIFTIFFFCRKPLNPPGIGEFMNQENIPCSSKSKPLSLNILELCHIIEGQPKSSRELLVDMQSKQMLLFYGHINTLDIHIFKSWGAQTGSECGSRPKLLKRISNAISKDTKMTCSKE